MSKRTTLISVKVIKGDINRALKKLKRRSNDCGHLLEVRDRKTYTKPTTARRREKQLAVRAQYKANILEKIEGGDTTVKWVEKVKKPYSKNNKSTPSEEKTIENYGLRMEK
jgi:ribosomal protein S21|tara:strand:+ start:569 stop:901 length:333 start_codon:yes stop_codon:yes gene_type:complete